MRHQRALDVPHNLLRRQLRRNENVDLLDRSVVTSQNLRGHDSRQREDEILSPLDREYGAGYR